MATVAFRVIVKGRVTGVGFRYSTVAAATRFPALQGYVRNADSRTVECVVQGPVESVDSLVAWLHHGPSYARVTDCSVVEIPVDPGLTGFDVSY